MRSTTASARAESLLQQLGGRDAIRNAGVIDLSPGPHEALSHRGLRDEERSCDLRNRETGDCAKRQRHSRRERQRRMAAGEDQEEAIVFDVV